MDKISSFQKDKNQNDLNRKKKEIVNISIFKMLIVEDNHLARKSLMLMLDQLGFKSDIASNGKLALALYNPHYRLILMDIDLPDINGITVTKTIRAAEALTDNHVPIVAMTSHYNEPGYQEKCLRAGMDGFCGKPNAEQLKQLIQTYCQE